jgi:hypothetical protein
MRLECKRRWQGPGHLGGARTRELDGTEQQRTRALGTEPDLRPRLACLMGPPSRTAACSAMTQLLEE